MKYILGHIKDDGIVFLPSELKCEGEPASNLRSGDIRKLSTDKNTEENSLIMNNILYIFNKTSFKYIQTALPREGRPISIDIKKLCDFDLKNFIDLKQYDLENKEEYEILISESIFKFMEKYGMMDKDKLLTATKGAYNKTMLADVFSFIEGVLILKGKEKTFTKRYRAQASTYLDTQPRDDNDKRIKDGSSKEYSCIHFYEKIMKEEMVRNVEEIATPNPQLLLDTFLDIIKDSDDDEDNDSKSLIIEFFEKYNLLRLSDCYVNDIDDPFLLKIFESLGIKVEKIM